MKNNRFTAFADEDAVAVEHKQVQQQVQQQKQQEKSKKVVVKVQKEQQHVENEQEFERVQDKNHQVARGSRGGERRGGDRGGRGGRGRGDKPKGDRPPREMDQDGQRRGRGEGRGGRGNRPRTAVATAAVDGVEGTEAKVEVPAGERRGGRGGRGPRFEGKPREGDHPMDRQDGTGRGRRGDKKDGHGRGNWGKTADGAEKVEGAEEKKEERPKREKREEKVEEPVVEEEEVGFTLDDYMNQKKAKATGMASTKEVRQHEKFDQKNAMAFDGHKADQQESTKIYKKIDTVAMRPNAGSELLGFSAGIDQGEEFESRGGASRGGRGGRREERPRTDNKPRQGGRKGGKIVVDDNEFPTL